MKQSLNQYATKRDVLAAGLCTSAVAAHHWFGIAFVVVAALVTFWRDTQSES